MRTLLAGLLLLGAPLMAEQRKTIPLDGMWEITDGQHGFPLMLRFPAVIRIWSRHAGVLVCYEQLLVWPALETLSVYPCTNL